MSKLSQRSADKSMFNPSSKGVESVVYSFRTNKGTESVTLYYEVDAHGFKDIKDLEIMPLAVTLMTGKEISLDSDQGEQLLIKLIGKANYEKLLDAAISKEMSLWASNQGDAAEYYCN